MEQWEYTTLKFKLKGLVGGKLDEALFDEELNRLGNLGWELVNCFAVNEGQGSSRDAVAVFKRKR